MLMLLQELPISINSLQFNGCYQYKTGDVYVKQEFKQFHHEANAK